MRHIQDIREKAVKLGFTGTGEFDPAIIKLEEGFRKTCATNVCRLYGTNWQCPPALPPLDEIAQTLKQYRNAVLVQTVVRLEDSFDFEGMTAGGDAHKKRMEELAAYVRARHGKYNPLILGAGGCRICAECAYIRREPCIFPDRALASVEGYGMFAGALTTAAGLKYNNGDATVSYVGLVLLK